MSYGDTARGKGGGSKRDQRGLERPTRGTQEQESDSQDRSTSKTGERYINGNGGKTRYKCLRRVEAGLFLLLGTGQ
jgi:hypothetical protein